MAEVKRWSVTYTKHLKQKRKAYRDGYLLLHSSSRKVMLYDESDTLLECRILKAEEDTTSGETLTFNAYLVDVGDPEGELKTSENPGIGSTRRNGFTSPCVSADRPSKTGKNGGKKISLSPSHKIIREFKTRELHKYGSLQKSSNSISEEPSGSVLEWHVLYTTQLTQKAKKFHDGFLRCPNTGSMSRQVMLYDESWKLLDSRFLKKGEEVKSDERIEFQGHLVEIGEYKEQSKTVPDMKVKERHCSSFQKLEIPKQDNINVGRSVVKEWQVLYTPQVTQKAKKYHDGFLQLLTCGSLGRQVMLYDPSRKLIDSRFLKKDEIIKSGDSLTFGAHLVEIGEVEGQETASETLNDGEKCSGSVGGLKMDHGNCNKDNESTRRVHSSERTCSVKITHTDNGSYSTERRKSSQGVSKDKPVRDASGILSILQKPTDRAKCANQSVLVNLDSPPNVLEDSDVCISNFCNGNELKNVSAIETSSVKQSISNQGTEGTIPLPETTAVAGRKISEETATASKEDYEWPHFDLGF